MSVGRPISKELALDETSGSQGIHSPASRLKNKLVDFISSQSRRGVCREGSKKNELESGAAKKPDPETITQTQLRLHSALYLPDSGISK
jgi:hypothetical protein